MKKSLLALLSVFILLFTACDSWMQDDDFYSDIENDVKVANAPQISVYVRYALTRQGKTDPDGTATFKVEIPHEISATTETEYGFVRWAAFTTDFVAPGDNQSLNKDVYYIDDEDYNERLLPHELTSPVVVFEDAKSPTTKVTINQERNDIFLVPLVAMRPAVSLTIPAKGSSGVVRNMSVRINFTKPMDIESFKNEAGKFDKITITQGTQSFTADGDIEINSEDITDYFEAPVFSKNKKMITLKFNAEHISEGYASQSSVNITISKDVKDIYGFTMTDDDKISFSVGSNKDTLAPRITQLTAGRDASSFNLFQGVYKDAETINNVGAGTKMTLEGAANAPADDIEASFYNPFVTIGQTPGYLVKNNVVIRVLAEDISGSGSGQSQTGIETDVAMIGMRAYHMFNADGTPSSFSYAEIDSEAGQAFKFKSSNYVPQTNLATSVSGAYKSVIEAINDTIDGTDNDFATDKGCLLDYDLSDMPDGLIRIDVAAVDMVQNSGFTDGGAYSPEYGNAWASLFVIKDTTPPDAAANSSAVHYDSSSATQITSEGWFNETTFNNFKILGDASSIADSGHPRLRAPHDTLKWNITANGGAWNTGWQNITADRTGFPLPTSDGSIYYTYTLMDSLGNVSSAASIPPFKYDGTASTVGILSFVADPGYSAGEARESILDHQILYIPITETMSGLKSIELKVNKNNGADYASPLSASSLVVSAFGEELTPGTHYTLDSAKKVITFTNSSTINGYVTIKGLKIADAGALTEGSYAIDVVVKDAAAASGAHESHAAQAAIINIDNHAPEIKWIYVPDLKATQRLGTTGTDYEYWQGAQETTDIYVKFTEASSGAKIFDFADSDVLTEVYLTEGSALYKLESSGAWTQVAASVNTAANRIEVNTAQDARLYFADSSDIIVKITNVHLSDEGTASTIKLKVYDTATNVANSYNLINSHEGSLNLVDNPGIENVTSFKYDSGRPASSNFILKDRRADYKDSKNKFIQAQAEFTNDEYVNAQVSLTQTTTNSGIISLTLSGDASFDSTTEIWAGESLTLPTVPLAASNLSDASKINADGYYQIAGGTQILFEVSPDGKTASFKNANGHLVLETTSLVIKNLKLTSGDDLKTLTVYPRTICGLSDLSGSGDTITLDKTNPVWNGKGLYSRKYSGLSETSVYPHAVEPADAADAYGVGLGTYSAAGTGAMEDLYFYRYAHICIGADFADDNAITSSDGKYARWVRNADEYTGTSMPSEGAYFYYSSSYIDGVWTVFALDKAGNKSIPVTLNLVTDNTFGTDTEVANIDRYMTFVKPEGAFIHRNDESTGIYNYVIKGTSDYKIKVMLGGASGETIDDLPAADGGTQLISDAYELLNNGTSSSKIEKYTVFTSYSYAEGVFESTDTIEWKDFKTSAVTSNQDSGITTYVDGTTIVINLPHNGCDPVVLGLKDGCGNTVYRRIRRAGMTNGGAVRWISDSEVASAVEGLTGIAEISAGSYNSYSDVAFYNGTVKLKVSELTESCRFPYTQFPAYQNGTDQNPNHPNLIYSNTDSVKYTMKSRIIVWTDSGTPDRAAFGNNDGSIPQSTPAASDWCFVQQSNYSSPVMPYINVCPVFYIENTFPAYATTTRYKLFLIMEDTVGNYEIRQIRRASNGAIIVSTSAPADGEVEYWFYDATPPAVTPANQMTYSKINTVGDTNYFSNNSYVDYNITDEGSGVWYDGVSGMTYQGFGTNRSITKRYFFENATVDTTDGNKIKIAASNIKDYAGNIYSSGDTNNPDITLEKGGKTAWEKQNTAPALSTNAAEAINTTLLADPNANLTGNTATVEDEITGYQKLYLTAKWGVTNITVKLHVDNPQSQILGWIVSDTKLTSFADFYSSVSPDVEYLSGNASSSTWKYVYNKSTANWGTPWHELYQGAKYFYPVNRAGIIQQTPVMVKFKTNEKPTIKNGNSAAGYDYTDNGTIGQINSTYLANDKVTDYKVKVSGTGATAINYTRNGAIVKVTTEDDSEKRPTKYRFVLPGQNGRLDVNQNETDDNVYLDYVNLTETGPTYTISLGSTAVGTGLGIQFARGDEEESDPYPLYGPTFSGHTGSNNWGYDSQSPEIAFVNTNPIMSGSASGTVPATFTDDALGIQYIEDANAYIKFTLTISDTDPSTAHFQWKTKTYSDSTGTWSAWSNWSDFYYNGPLSGITSFSTSSGELTFPAPESKTQYMFRVVDVAGNISSEDTTAKLQRDQWAPGVDTENGRIAYKLMKNATDQVSISGMDIPYSANGTTDENTRVISYSKSGTYLMDHIWVDLSRVTDNRNSSGAVAKNGIERSGIWKYEVTMKKDGVVQTTDIPAAPAANATEWIIPDLTTNAHGDNVEFEYTLKVYDNLQMSKAENERTATTLKTFKIKVDSTAPTLGLAAVVAEDSTDPTAKNVVQTSANEDGSSPVNRVAKTDDGVYYLNKDYAVINLTKTESDIVKYEVRKRTKSGSNWSEWSDWPESDITDAVRGKDTNTPYYVFATPDVATQYQFRARDGVDNYPAWTAESGVTPTSIITIQKDDAISDNTVTWTFNKTSSSDSTDVATYYKETSPGSGVMTYNGNKVNQFVLDVSTIANASDTSGIRRYWLKIGNANPVDSLTATNPAFETSETVKKWPIGIATTGSGSVTYKIWAEDWAGNLTAEKEFTLTTDVDSPNLSLTSVAAQGDGDEYTVTKYPADATGVYYLKNNFAVVKLATTTSGDIAKYVWFNSSATTPVDLTLSDAENLKHKFDASAVTAVTDYTFKAVDAVGNESDPVTIKIAQDQTSPTGTISYEVQKTGATPQVVDASHVVGDYKVSISSDTLTTTITYNPTKVEKIVFTPNITDEIGTERNETVASGWDEKLYYRTSSEDTPITDNTITLGDTGASYLIIAKDHAGNVKTFGTYVFTPDNTAPEMNNVTPVNWHNRVVKQINDYVITAGAITYAMWIPRDDRQRANSYASGTKISFAKVTSENPTASIPAEAVQYQMVKTVTTSNTDTTDGYTASATALVEANWSAMTLTADGNSFEFELPNGDNAIHTPYTRLSLFFRDVLGNVSGPYYLGNNTGKNQSTGNQVGIQWWINGETLTETNVKVLSATYNNGNGSGWNSEAPQQDYTVTVQLPVGSIIHSVFLAPKPTEGQSSTGVVLSETGPLFTLSGYTSEQTDNIKKAYSNEGYIVLPSSEGSTTGKLSLKIFPHTNITEPTSVLIKINSANADATGVSKQVFPTGGYPNNINRLGTSGIIRGGDSASGESAGARLVQFFNGFFSGNDEVLSNTGSDSSIVEKPAKAKKAAKKAKKAAKKNSKKASEKVVSIQPSAYSTTGEAGATTAASGSSTGKPVMSVYSAEILAQNEKSTLPEIAVATETVVNEIAGVTQKIESDMQVVSIQPSAYSTTADADSSSGEVSANTEEEDSSPSKSASIVIMLAILSSLGGAWYYMKSRKK